MSLEQIFNQPLRVINLGLEVFVHELEEQGVTVLHVDWRPPHDLRVAELLSRLDDEESDSR